MSNNYDNWERLVVAVLRREKDRQLALAHSRESSISSGSSSFNFGLDSPVHEQSLQLEASSSKVNETDRERLFPSATSSSPGLSRFSAAASDETRVSGVILPTSNLKIFTFAELKIATRNFNSALVLGSGDFGTVFKGWADSKTLSWSVDGARMAVAIKKLHPERLQGFEEWQSEVNFLGRLSHPNLIKLHGYCRDDKELILVYEFMQRGSLENYLFRRSVAIEPLSWDIRLKIAIGAACGLAFLHTSDVKVIYRDFKASKILLDANYNAKIDFGFAKLGPAEGNSHVTTRVMGTLGYAAPEYVATGHLYVKSDVYGFGVVLLEMLTGLRVLDCKRPNGQQRLVDYAKPLLFQKRKLKTIMDPRMEGQYSSKAALQAAQLILRCLEIEPRKRPSMQEVVEELEKIAAIGKPKESKTEVMHSSSRLDNYRDTESEAVRGDTEDGRVSMDVGENVEELITSPYPPEEDSDAEIPQPYSSEDDCHEELEDELGDF